MTDLADFLIARIAEDEAMAQAASFLRPTGPDPAYVSPVDNLRRLQQRYDPPRVLAECEARRRVVGLHQPIRLGADPLDCRTCREPYEFEAESWPCETLRVLALPYADHPDYRTEWRP